MPTPAQIARIERGLTLGPERFAEAERTKAYRDPRQYPPGPEGLRKAAGRWQEEIFETEQQKKERHLYQSADIANRIYSWLVEQINGTRPVPLITWKPGERIPGKASLDPEEREGDIGTVQDIIDRFTESLKYHRGEKLFYDETGEERQWTILEEHEYPRIDHETKEYTTQPGAGEADVYFMRGSLQFYRAEHEKLLSLLDETFKLKGESEPSIKAMGWAGNVVKEQLEIGKVLKNELLLDRDPQVAWATMMNKVGDLMTPDARANLDTLESKALEKWRTSGTGATAWEWLNTAFLPQIEHGGGTVKEGFFDPPAMTLEERRIEVYNKLEEEGNLPEFQTLEEQGRFADAVTKMLQDQDDTYEKEAGRAEAIGEELDEGTFKSGLTAQAAPTWKPPAKAPEREDVARRLLESQGFGKGAYRKALGVEPGGIQEDEGVLIRRAYTDAEDAVEQAEAMGTDLTFEQALTTALGDIPELAADIQRQQQAYYSAAPPAPPTMPADFVPDYSRAVTDPDTGEPVIDPDTGRPKREGGLKILDKRTGKMRPATDEERQEQWAIGMGYKDTRPSEIDPATGEYRPGKSGAVWDEATQRWNWVDPGTSAYEKYTKAQAAGVSAGKLAGSFDTRLAQGAKKFMEQYNENARLIGLDDDEEPQYITLEQATTMLTSEPGVTAAPPGTGGGITHVAARRPLYEQFVAPKKPTLARKDVEMLPGSAKMAQETTSQFAGEVRAAGIEAKRQAALERGKEADRLRERQQRERTQRRRRRQPLTTFVGKLQ